MQLNQLNRFTLVKVVVCMLVVAVCAVVVGPVAAQTAIVITPEATPVPPPTAETPVPFVQFLNILLTTMVTVATPIVVGFVIELIRQSLARVKASVSNQQWGMLWSLASTVVMAAEQSGLSGQIINSGKAKKEWAIKELERIAAERGLAGLDVQTLSAIIETEVFRQFKQANEADHSTKSQ